MKLDKLTEATILALRGKLNESTNIVLDKNKIAEFLKGAITDLITTDYTCTWYDLDKDLAIFVGWTDGYDPEDEDYIHAENDPSYVIAAKIASTHEYMKTDLDWLVQPYYEDGEVWDTEITLNNNSNFTEDADWFIKSYKGIREALDRGELLLENKKQEARNPENDDINDKIRKTIHGSRRYEDELKEKGLEVHRGTPVTVTGSNHSIDSYDLKQAPTDMDLYNYLTKNKVKPKVTSNGNAGYFTKSARKEYANDPFMKDPFYNTIGNNDKLAGKGDSNDVSKAIPKKYKTGKSAHTSNNFPDNANNFNGVVSYEPLTNKELDNFKSNKEDLKIRDKKIDVIKNDYAEQEKSVNDIRDKIAKSKANRKQEARSHKEDNEKAAPRGEFNTAPRYIKNSPYNEIDVPKRAIIHKSEKPNEDGVVWGVVNKDEIDTYEQSTPDIERYKEYKADAERERDNAKYYNALAKQSDDRASDIVRDKKLNRAKRNLNNQENKKETEARSHKEDNERVAPRTVKNALGNDVETREMVDVSNPAVGNKSYHNEKGSQYWGTTEAEYASKRNKTGQKNEFGYDVYLAPFKNTGDWTMNSDRMEPATATARYQYNKGQAENDKERVDYYTRELKRVRSPYKKAIAQSQIDSFEKSRKENDDKAHQIYQDMKDKYNKKAENKKVTETTTDVNEIYDDYKKAYGKDLDLKTVPCVIARDKMLSGWGGAEGKTHYQVVLCADSTEARNIGYKMQAEAKREQLSNVRVSFGVKIPRGGSVAYCVGRYASAWNMGDSWYERYDKKAENKSIKVKGLRKFEGVRAIEEYEYEFDDLYDIVGENGKSVLDDIRNANKEDEFIDYLISIMGEDTGKLPTVGELSDFIDFDFDTIFRDLEMKTESESNKK